jgi:rare lipoprotein A
MRIHLILIILFTCKMVSGTPRNLASDRLLIITDTIDNSRQKNEEKVQYGVASYYHSKFTGRPTASGELYEPSKLTAAHNGLPLGTWVKVTNTRNKRSVIVKINDRMHSRNKRLVDLSRSAAIKLGYVGKGLTKVKLEVLGKKKPKGL